MISLHCRWMVISVYTVNWGNANTITALVTWAQLLYPHLCSVLHKDRGLGRGSICEVRTARRDVRNIRRIVGWFQTLTLPTAALTKLHSVTTVYNNMNGMNTSMSESQWGVAGDPGPDTTKPSLDLQHRYISEMFSLLVPHNISMKKKCFRGGGCVCLSVTCYHNV